MVLASKLPHIFHRTTNVCSSGERERERFLLAIIHIHKQENVHSKSAAFLCVWRVEAEGPEKLLHVRDRIKGIIAISYIYFNCFRFAPSAFLCPVYRLTVELRAYFRYPTARRRHRRARKRCV